MTLEKLREYEPLFGSWVIEGKIAEGRHSKVFKASAFLDNQTQHQCIKTIKFPSGDEELSAVIASGIYQNVQQYLDELETSVRSNMDLMLTFRGDKNIVRFDDYTIIKESSCFYLVILMELLTPLNDYLDMDSITQNDVIDLGSDICCALECFRAANILHHEVKPENIYVDGDGNYKLGDFGVSKGRFGEDKAVSSYVAPELYAYDAVDLNSDIYSLGILLYKLLNNNRLPFLPSYPAPVSIEDRESAFTRRMRGDLFPAPANATSPLANVLYKATAFRTNERFTNPIAFMQALEANYVSAEAPVEDPPVPVVPVNPYHITDDTGVPLYEQSPVRHSEVTDEDRENFAEVFSDDDEEAEEDVREGEKVAKKWYVVIVALVAVLVVIIAIIAKSNSSSKKETTTTTTSGVTFGEQTSGPSTTTQPTTTETTTSATTTTESTTESTTETTTTATTTTETTTTTTTSATTTTETTTTATTTATTTESTTTTLPTTESTTAAYTEPVLVYSPNTENGKDTRGRSYKSVELTIEEGFDRGNEVVLVVEGLEGENAETDDNFVTVCTMDNSRMVKRSQAVLFIESESAELIKLRITADDTSFSFEPDKYQYFICLEDGAVSTESTVNLGTQIRIEK